MPSGTKPRQRNDETISDIIVVAPCSCRRRAGKRGPRCAQMLVDVNRAAYASGWHHSVSVGGKETDASDIDGVDFRRWFQWEDDGLIPLEIDLPPMKPTATVKVYAVSPHGVATWIIKVGKATRK